MNKESLILGKPLTNKRKWLAKLKAKWTLYLDDDLGFFINEKPISENASDKIKKNQILCLYFDDDYIEGCEIVGKTLKTGKCKIGWKTLQESIEDENFDILEFTEQCKKLYLEELCKTKQ